MANLRVLKFLTPSPRSRFSRRRSNIVPRDLDLGEECWLDLPDAISLEIRPF